MDDQKSFIELGFCRSVEFLQESYDQIWEDSAHQHIVVRIGRKFHVVSLAPGPDGKPASLSGPRYEELPTTGLDSGATVLGVRFSLDFKLLALQMIPTLVKVVDLVHSKDWNVKVRHSKSNAILPEGIIWSDHAGTSQDLILITSRGLELHKVNVAKAFCRLSRSVDIAIHNFWYEPKHRVIMLSCGDKGTKMRVYFLIRDAKSASSLPQFELPPPEKAPSFYLDVCPDRADVAVSSLYGAPHAIVLNKKSGELDVYRMLKTQTERVCRLNLPGQIKLWPNSCKFSFSDNLLIVHLVQRYTSLVYDIEDQPSEKLTGPNGKEVPPLLNPSCAIATPVVYHPSAVGVETDHQAKASFLYSGEWPLLWPHHVLDITNLKLWMVVVNLEILAERMRSAKSLAAFLQRRGMLDAACVKDHPKPSSLLATNMLPLPPKVDIAASNTFDIAGGIGRTAKDLILSRLSELLEGRTSLNVVSSYLKLLLGPYARACSNTSQGGGSSDTDIFEGMNQTWARNLEWQLEPRGGFGYFAIPLTYAVHPIFKQMKTWGQFKDGEQMLDEASNDMTVNYGFIHPDLMGQPEFWAGFARREPPRCPKGMLVVLQCDVFAGVFLPLLTSSKTRPKYQYLASALLELAFQCSRLNVKLEPYISVMVIGLLLAPEAHQRKGNVERALQILSSRMLPDSSELALCLIHIGSCWSNLNGFARAGIDMLYRMKQWKLLFSELLDRGHFEEACDLWQNLKSQNVDVALALTTATDADSVSIENKYFKCAIKKILMSAEPLDSLKEDCLSASVLHNAYLFIDENKKEFDNMQKTFSSNQQKLDDDDDDDGDLSPFSLSPSYSSKRIRLKFPMELVNDPEVAERLAMLCGRKAQDFPYVEFPSAMSNNPIL